LSGGEKRMLKAMESWSKARIVKEHRLLVRLVSKVRRRLEQVVDDAPRGWVPDHDFSVAYAATVGGGARLVDSYYKKEKSSEQYGMTDEELNKRIKRDFVEMLEEAPLEDLEKIVSRKRMELRQGKPMKLPSVIDVEAP
jgi:hypothetical protein